MELPEYDSECDLEYTLSIFRVRSKMLELYAIDVAQTTLQDIQKLPSPKNCDYDDLHTVAFFCRNGNDWFIYRVIIPISQDDLQKSVPELIKLLGKVANRCVYQHRRCKDPLKYLRQMTLVW